MPKDWSNHKVLNFLNICLVVDIAVEVNSLAHLVADEDVTRSQNFSRDAMVRREGDLSGLTVLLFLTVFLSDLVDGEHEIGFNVSHHDAHFFEAKEAWKVGSDVIYEISLTSLGANVASESNNLDCFVLAPGHLLLCLDLRKFKTDDRGQNTESKPVYHGETNEMCLLAPVDDVPLLNRR